jgi:type III pantothenate kinase
VILVFDVGNTELTIGLFSESELRGHWRIVTDVARTPDEFGVLLRALSRAWRSAPWCRA